jgi:hypothetical protein
LFALPIGPLSPSCHIGFAGADCQNRRHCASVSSRLLAAGLYG